MGSMTASAKSLQGLWPCPKCGRAFAKLNQMHSCQVRPLEEHFRGRDPKRLATYKVLIAGMNKIGPVRVNSVKSCIHFSSKFAFAGVVVKRDYLRLNFLYEKALEDRSILWTQKLTPPRVEYGLALASPTDITPRLLRWLRDSYSMQSK